MYRTGRAYSTIHVCIYLLWHSPMPEYLNTSHSLIMDLSPPFTMTFVIINQLLNLAHVWSHFFTKVITTQACIGRNTGTGNSMVSQPWIPWVWVQFQNSGPKATLQPIAVLQTHHHPHKIKSVFNFYDCADPFFH